MSTSSQMDEDHFVVGLTIIFVRALRCTEKQHNFFAQHLVTKLKLQLLTYVEVLLVLFLVCKVTSALISSVIIKCYLCSSVKTSIIITTMSVSDCFKLLLSHQMITNCYVTECSYASLPSQVGTRYCLALCLSILNNVQVKAVKVSTQQLLLIPKKTGQNQGCH